jgi:hypothetical protein
LLGALKALLVCYLVVESKAWLDHGRLIPASVRDVSEGSAKAGCKGRFILGRFIDLLQRFEVLIRRRGFVHGLSAVEDRTREHDVLVETLQVEVLIGRSL